jgi:hypothetical protein
MHLSTDVSAAQKNLLVVSCSATKLGAPGDLPALYRYDGPVFRVLRAFMRDHHWPPGLSVAVLSAQYGLIGALASIAHYDRRMDSLRASELCSSVTKTLLDWKGNHNRVHLVLGKDYQRSVGPEVFAYGDATVQLRPGPIGRQLHHVSGLLRESLASRKEPVALLRGRSSPLYFLPDWDDFLDVDFDFEADRLSAVARSMRQEAHSVVMMRPHRLCDGVLVSLAQHMGAKGLLGRVDPTSPESLMPRSVRDHFKLDLDQLALGDCGAFSYIAEDRPLITVEQAVAMYDLYDFDIGASVDHIPVAELKNTEGKRQLTREERGERVSLTRDNADRFLQEHRRRRARFTPLGVIQRIAPEDYAAQVGDYLDMGYQCLALGGLVPRSDAEMPRAR